MGKANAYDDAWLSINWRKDICWASFCELYNLAHGTSYKPNAIKNHCISKLGLKRCEYKPNDYDNKWIFKNWKKIMSWRDLCDLYNESHSTKYPYNIFTGHCTRDLKLSLKYTKEEEDWLKRFYPILGTMQAADEFYKIFGKKRTPMSIRSRARMLGLYVDSSRKTEIRVENAGRRHPIGTIRKLGHGEPNLKTRNGWVPLKELFAEKEPGKVIIHLDRDVDNYNKENLMVVDRSVLARMTKNGFWSDDPEITKTGVVWCELADVLKGEKYGY